MPAPIRVLLADSQPISLAALAGLLHGEAGIEVVGCCEDGEETVRMVSALAPDILLLDLHMPSADGLAVLRQLDAEGVATRTVLLTGQVTDEEVLAAMRLGVRGVVLKAMAPRLLFECLRKVHAGEQWLEKQSVSRALDRLLSKEAGYRDKVGLLTPRETAVVRLVAQGQSNKEVAQGLGITEGTVKVHLHSAYLKARVGNRLALTRWAEERQIL